MSSDVTEIVLAYADLQWQEVQKKLTTPDDCNCTLPQSAKMRIMKFLADIHAFNHCRNYHLGKTLVEMARQHGYNNKTIIERALATLIREGYVNTTLNDDTFSLTNGTFCSLCR